MQIKQAFFNLIMPVVKLYWRVFKPESYGARVLIVHPTEKNKVLLVRHSYGNTTLWNIPGGGYNPKKEPAAAAAAREVLEELRVRVIDLQELGEYKTSSEGKRDTVIMFSGTLENIEEMIPNPEISELAWVEAYTVSERGNDVARVARRAVEKIL